MLVTHLQGREIVVYQQGQSYGGKDQEDDPEGVLVAIVGGFEFNVDQV